MAPRMNVPPLTRGILIGLVVLTFANALFRPGYGSWLGSVDASLVKVGHGVPWLSVIPGQSIVYPWTFLTATLVEQNLFALLITGPALFYGGRYLERAWSSQEYAKFMLFIGVIPNILSFALYVFAFVLSRNEAALTTTISGGISIQAAFLVAFKQLVPEHTVSVMRNIIRMRVKHFPAIFLLTNTISGLVFGTETAMFLAWFGFFTAWIYLRFYRRSPTLSAATGGEPETIKGDASDTFAFAFFFPEPLHTPVAGVADRVYDVLVTLRVCTPFSSEDIDASNEQASARADGRLPSLMNSRPGRSGGRREEAERRRALALKVLDQRLGAATSKPIQHPAPAVTTNSIGPSMLGETNYEPERHDEDHGSGTKP
ncbi:cytochrome c oxidase subunit I [Patellaria atrata CBS 101060]|uniref:Cytochrome c oxidase subunit I n=1 Tax=Patellaria atrata CBS 101060 TaxID=1346257 RepID=A0A9P4VQB7_9PEZI|nr:cytochrome c oxidase subunit I [Patellaria atrata CBS 101060]